MKKLLVFGDSNTYGFDPRGFSGGRYPLPEIWTTLADDALGNDWTVVNKGMNGRRIPCHEESFLYVEGLLEGLSSDDVFAVMLGSNDLLMTLEPDAQEAARKMEAFISWLKEHKGCPEILLIAPAYVSDAGGTDPLYSRYNEESIKMNEGFRALAQKYGILFADAGKWNIPLAFDQVHFSEEGHKVFAGKIFDVIRSGIVPS